MYIFEGLPESTYRGKTLMQRRFCTSGTFLPASSRGLLPAASANFGASPPSDIERGGENG